VISGVMNLHNVVNKVSL